MRPLIDLDLNLLVVFRLLLQERSVTKAAKKLNVTAPTVSKALARLHARGKPNVQEEKGSRTVTEDDAEFSLATVGLLLREIGWAI